MILRIIITTSLVLLLAGVSFAAGSITISSAGNNTYMVNGSSMDGVAGIELQVSYGNTSLSTPTVTAGSLVSGAMFAANPNITGIIKVAIVSTTPFSGNGPIAKIVFASGSGTPILTSFSTIDFKGVTLSSSLPDPNVPGPGTFGQTSTSTSTASTSTTANTSASNVNNSTTSTSTSSSSSSTPTYPGTVSLPQDFASKPDVKPPATKQEQPVWEQPASTPDEQPQAADKSVPSKKEAENVTEQYLVYKGVVDRFKQYSGEKTLAKLSELYKREVATNIHQEPSPVLSDGTTQVTLTVDLPARITDAPNFAMNGAKLLSHKQEPTMKGRWILSALPEKSTSTATLTILAGSEGFEYPLTVAPPHNSALKLDEAGWNQFLKNSGTVEVPLYDLNQDGVRDFRDEYIFVTNYLVQQARPVPTGTKPEAPKTTSSAAPAEPAAAPAAVPPKKAPK